MNKIMRAVLFSLIFCACLVGVSADEPVHPLDGGSTLPISVTWFSAPYGMVTVVFEPRAGETAHQLSMRAREDIEDYWYDIFPPLAPKP